MSASAATASSHTPPHKRLSPEQRALLTREYDNTLACIRCGLCLSVCPTYLVTRSEAESPRGRIAMARALIEGHLDLTPDLVQHEQSCLLCEACTAVCPAGIRMEELGLSLRSVLAEADRAPWPRRWLQRLVFRGLFLDMGRFRWFVRAVRMAQRAGLVRLAKHLHATHLLGLGHAAELLPAIDSAFLVPRGQTWPATAETSPAQIGLFAGCIMSTVFASTTRATAALLARSGRSVTAPAGQACCGALHAHNGDLEAAKQLARQNIEAFDKEPLGAIAVNAAGCGSMLKSYGHLLADDPMYAARAAAFARRVKDVTELLAERQPPLTRSIERRAVFQQPCHLVHAQRITAEPRALLQRVPGLTLLDLEEADVCCGSAGVYNITHPTMAEALLQRKVGRILESGADLVITANPGCLLQIQAGLRRAKARVEVRHLVDVLAAASGDGGE